MKPATIKAAATYATRHDVHGKDLPRRKKADPPTATPHPNSNEAKKSTSSYARALIGAGKTRAAVKVSVQKQFPEWDGANKGWYVNWWFMDCRRKGIPTLGDEMTKPKRKKKVA